MNRRFRRTVYTYCVNYNSSDRMPKNSSSRLGMGGNRRRAVDGSEKSSSNKGTKKLPPLKSNTIETNGDMIQTQYQRLSGKLAGKLSGKLSSAGRDESKLESGGDLIDRELRLNLSNSIDSTSVTSSSRPAGLRAGGRRRGGIKAAITSTYNINNNNSTGSNNTTRRSSKQKNQTNDQDSTPAITGENNTLVKSKSRKKILKPKPPDKQSEGETLTQESSDQPQNPTKNTTKPQWTNIVRKVQIHKHQTIKSRNKNGLKKKDSFFKKQKSEFVIENTWIPRDNQTIGSSSASSTQKLNKKSKKKTSKANKDCNTVDNRSVALTLQEERDYDNESKEDDNAGNSVSPVMSAEKHISSATVTYDRICYPVDKHSAVGHSPAYTGLYSKPNSL